MTTITTHIGGATITVPNAELAPFVPPPQTRITAVAFKRRFTPTERIAIRAAAQANAQVYDYMDLLNSGLAVHVTDHVVHTSPLSCYLPLSSLCHT